MVTCDRCNSEIKTGEGYAVYSESRTDISGAMKMLISKKGSSGTEMGALLVCANCANGLFTEQVWATARKMSVEIDPTAAFTKSMKETQSQVINFSVAMRAKRRGLNSSEAKEEARKIARLWYTNQEAAEQQLLAQRSAPQKKWWKFWG